MGRRCPIPTQLLDLSVHVTNDDLFGGGGNDDSFGGAGNDLVVDHRGVDELLGRAGNDRLDDAQLLREAGLDGPAMLRGRGQRRRD